MIPNLPLPLPFGLMLRQAVILYRENFIAILILAGIPSLLTSMVPARWWFGPLFPVALLLTLLGLTFTALTLNYLLLKKAKDEPLDAAELQNTISQLYFPMFVANFLAGFGILMGLVLFYVPGLILFALVLLFQPIIVAEGRGGFWALKRAAALSRGFHLRNFAFFTTVAVPLLLASALITGWAAPQSAIDEAEKQLMQKRIERKLQYESLKQTQGPLAANEQMGTFDEIKEELLFQADLRDSFSGLTRLHLAVLNLLEVVATSFLIVLIVLMYQDMARLEGLRQNPLGGLGTPQPPKTRDQDSESKDPQDIPPQPPQE